MYEKPQEKRNHFVVLDKKVMKAAKLVSLLPAAGMLIVAFLAFIDVILAKFFGTAIPSGTEFIKYILIPIVYLSVAHVQLDRGMINVDLIGSHLPKPVRSTIAVFSNLLGAAVFGFIGVEALTLLQNTFTLKEKCSTLSSAFYLWPYVLCMVVGLALLVLAFLWCIVRICVMGGDYRPVPENKPEGGDGQ